MASATFTPEEWQALAAYGLTQADAEGESGFRVNAEQLVNDESCVAVLEQIKPALGAPNLKVAASLTIKRLAFLVLAPTLYALSRFDKGLDVSLAQCEFDYALKDRIWQSKMPLKRIDVTPLCGDRADWRIQVLTQAFAEHLSPVVETMHRLTRSPKRILWENVAVRVFSIYERRVLPGLEGEQKALAQADYAWLLSDGASEVFGLDTNPIAEFDSAFTELESAAEPVRVRRTCCYYYRATEPQEFCSNCPLPLRLKRNKKA
ncbi:IucA/IucC family C-terminal-domain containing protein [Marinomonas ostreistagni]|uniref:IucA/IucC family C-terminal-domain containing protein n=1 Tax=Marinomonas ostreistagni TaxID=359209 RepID=UPI00194F0A75|nr:IucA/IucC family C-terminal-domain containing protein [Marinomonas ostreistagni]MBM6550788.1 (2Fe-2S)-binding protein [Marinomonas ostreistagni]